MRNKSIGVREALCHSGTRVLSAAMLFVFVLATVAGCGRVGALKSRPRADWQELLGATENAQKAKSQQIDMLLSKSLANDAPMWPVDTFLRAELHRLRGEIPDARRDYRALAEWGAMDPYKDGWGGSGLTAIALWRWLQIAGTEVDKEEVRQLLECAKKLRSARLIRGIFSAPLLAALPQVEEESGRSLARLAWLAGRRDEAERLFLDYLQVARTKERNEVENQMWEDLVKSGQASDDRLTLLVATRLTTLGQQETAATMLEKLRGSNDAEVRAQAGYHLATLQRVQGDRRQDVVDTLSKALEDAGDPRLFQQILFERSVTYNLPGKGHDDARSKQDLEQLISEFPEGSLANRAMYELARRFQQAGDTEQALDYFGKLQQREHNNDRFELSYYQAALALYARAGPGELTRSKMLLEFLGKRPNASLRLAALFWLGRLAEESGDSQQAQNYYRQIVDQSPYDYYAIRSRMHMSLGMNARLEVWPDKQTENSLSVAYHSSVKDMPAPGDSPYANRLREGLEADLYSSSLQADGQLRHAYASQRVEDLTPEELDSSGTLSRISLLLAFRQDALAATDSHPKDRLQFAVSLGGAQDWPLAISLCEGTSGLEGEDAKIQQEAGFLSAAYPIVFREDLSRAGEAYHVQPELLYGIARRESSLYPYALSSSGALGLFQFTPATFRDLDINQKWKLLESNKVGSYQEFLLNPKLSIELGARWFREELLSRNNDNVVGALLEHNAGGRAAKEWTSRLQSAGRFEDVEYAVESIPYMDTRRFTRGVLTDMAIVSGAGILHAEANRPHESSKLPQ